MRPIENRVIVLAIHEDRVYYCNTLFIPIASLEGKLQHQFTMCRIKSFDVATGMIMVKIETSGPLGKSGYLANSEANLDIFKTIEIKGIKIYGQNKPLNPSKIEKAEKYLKKTKIPSSKIIEHPYFLTQVEKEIEKYVDIAKILPVSELIFGRGIISFQVYIKEVSNYVDFEVLNSIAQPEFNSIKKYFAAQFENGNANVSCQVRYQGATVLEAKVISHNIDLIDRNAISIIIDDLIRDHIIDFDTDEIRPLEDILKDVYAIPEEDVEQWLMSKLSDESLTKHHEHLMYLSGCHDRQLFPLKVTGKPISFMFGLRNNNRVFVVWETHNTKEATYIWRLTDQPIDGVSSSIIEIENNIKMLRQRTKRAYRSDNKTNPHFKVVEHDYSLPIMDLKNGVHLWKNL